MIKVLVDCGCATITKDDQSVTADGTTREPIARPCSRPGHRVATGRRKLSLQDSHQARQVLAACQTGCVRSEKNAPNQDQLVYVTQDEKESLKGSCAPLP